MSFGKTSGQTMARTSGWVKRTIHAAVVVAVAASVPTAWSAGGGGRASIRVNNVAAGHAFISQAGNVTTIRTASQNTIINYQRFDVNSGQTVRFAQPNAGSRVLNRIQGDGPSSINGTITSNGIVYLVNPAGIMFGPGAVVNVGQFFAAGARMSDQDFLSGANHFTDAAGRVVNQGMIRANQVHLAGAQVSNMGMIVTDGSAGIVTLTAGKDIMIGEVSNAAATPLIVVKMTAPGNAKNGGPAVSNSGTIRVGNGQVLLGAGDVYGIAIANSGMLKGRTITLQGGHGITESTGTIDASSLTGTGGAITLVGQLVGIAGVADASGATGGGAVRIGGDFHGGGTLRTADKTTVTSTATIKADATGAGNGGTVVVWSNLGTVYAGSISAVGAGAGNVGGRVEVSGGTLGFTGSVNLAAAGTTTGSLLLDPTTLNIDTTGADDATFTGNITFAQTPATMNISAGKIVTLLETSALDLQATTLLHVKTSIDASGDAAAAGNGLTLEVGAAGTIQIDSGLTIKTNNADLNFKVGTGGEITVGGGNVTASAGTGILTIGGAVTDTGTTNLQLTGDTLAINGAINVGGTLTIASNSAATGLSIGNNLTAASVSLTSGNTVTNTAAIDTHAANGNVAITSAGVSLSGGTINAGTGTVNLNNADPTAAITLAGTGTGYLIKPADVATITAGALTIGLSGTQSGAITATKFAGSAITIPVTLNSNHLAGGVVLDDGGTATALALGGALTINAGTGGITAASATNALAELSIGGTVGLSSGGGIGTSAKRVSFASGQTGVTLSAATAIDVNGLGNLSLVTATASGGTVDVTTSGTGNINASGLLSASTTVSLNAGGGIGTSGTISVLAPSGLTLTTAGLASAGNISVSTTAATLLNPVISVDSGGGQTISLSGNALSFTTDLDVNTADLVLTGASLNVGGAATITAGNFTVTGITSGGATVAGTLDLSGDFLSNGTGDFTLTGGSITAGTVRITAGNLTDGGTGFVSATNLGVNATGNVTLTDAMSNAVGTFAASGAVNKSITFKNSSTLTVGTVSAVTNFALATGVTTSGTAGVTLQSDGTMTVSQVVTGGSGGASLKTVTAGDIDGTATVSGTSVTVNAAGGIGLTGTGLSISAGGTGAVSLTTAGTGSAGNIKVSTGAGALDTPTISINSGGGQTVTLGGGAVTLGNTDLTGANLVVNATSFALTASDTVTASTAKIALTGGATISGTLNLNGEFDSTGTTFGVGGTITTDVGDINILHTGAVTISGTLETDAGNIRIAGSTVTETTGATITTNGLGVRATGAGAAIDLGQTNDIFDFSAATTTAGATINLVTSSGVTTNPISGLSASAPFPAFATVTGITTNNGDVAIHAGNAIEINNVLNAGTGTVALFCPDTFGSVSIDAAVTGGIVEFGAANNVTIRAAVNANNSGSGGFTATGVGLDISAAGSLSTDGTATLIHTGAVTFEGSASAITLNIQGQTVTQTTGTLTATNLGVKTTGTGAGVGDITLPGVTLNASGQIAAVSATGKTIDITSSDAVSIGTASSTTALSNTGGTLTFAALSGINSGTGTASLTASAASITGSQTVTGATVNLTATAGGIGTTSTPVGVSATNINLTTGGAGASGDIYITTGGAAVNTSTLSVTTNALWNQTVSIVSGAFTVDSDFSIGTDDLQVGGTTFTSNTTKTLTVGDLLFVGSGQVSLAGTITAGSGGGSILLSAADVIQTGGALNAGALSTITTSKNGSNQAVQLTAGTNDITTFVAKSTSADGTVALTTNGATTVGSTGSTGGTGGVGTFAANTGVGTNNADILIKAGGDFDGYQPINAGTGKVAIWTLPASAGTITIHTSASVTGAIVNFAADNSVSIASAVTATNSGAGQFTSTGGGTFGLVSGGSVTTDFGSIIHTGDVNLGGAISAISLEMQGATIGQTAGLVTATTLGLRSTINGVTLTNLTFNADGTVAAVATVNQNVTITATNGIQIGAAPLSMAPDNAGTFSSFASISGVTTTGTGITSLTATTGNITGNGTDPVAGTTVNLTATAGGIGASGTDVIVNTTGTATLITGGASAAGDVYMTTSGSSLGAFTFTTAAGSAQTINIDKTGALTLNGNLSTVNDNLVVTATGALALGNSVAIGTGTGSITLRAGTSGLGDLSFGTSDTLTSPTVLLEAGSQNGTNATAVVNITNVPTLSGTTSLTVRQDGSITDAGVALGSGENYTLQSDGGNVTVSTGGNVAGTNLTLTPKTGGTVSIDAAMVPDSLVSNGATTNLGGNVTSSGDQTYNGNVVLTQNETLSGANLTFDGTIVSQASQAFTLDVTGSASTVFDGDIGGTIGGTSQLGSLTVSGAALTMGLGGAFTVTTMSFQTYNPAVTLAADTTLNNINVGAISFLSTVDGARNLAVNSAGNESFGGKVGFTTALTSLTTDSAASGIFGNFAVFSGGSSGTADPTVKTTGAQLYRDGVSLDADTTFTSTGSGDITFGGTVDGAGLLIINTGGQTTFTGVVGGITRPTSITTDAAGTLHINADITVADAITFNDPATLTADATVANTGSAAITFNSTIDGDHNLVVNTSGDTLFNGIIGGTTALASLTTDAGTAGVTTFNIGGVHTVLTVNDQSYGDDVVLANDTVFNSNAGGDITFHKTVNGSSAGGQALSVNTAGDEIFNGKVGGTAALASLTTDDPTSGVTGLPAGLVHFNYASGGATDFSVATTGDQNYHDNVQLGGNTVLSSTVVLHNITFFGTINATTAGGQSLTVNAVNDEFFDGKIGGSAALASLTTDDPSSGIMFVPHGNVHFNYASTDVSLATPDVSVLTTGPQHYYDDATLGNDTVLKSTGVGSAGDIDFNGVLNGTTSGGQALTVITAGATTFNGIVGGSVALSSLTTDSAGTTVFNNASPTTTTAQDFFDAVILESDTIFTSNPGSFITFHSTVDSDSDLTPRSLVTISDTNTTFDGAIGATHALYDLTVIHNPLSALPGTINLNGGTVNTIGLQTYGYKTVLGSNTVLTSTATGINGGDITFASSVDGDVAGRTLTINTPANEIFNGQVGGSVALASLMTDDPAAFGTGPGLIPGAPAGSVHFNYASTGPTDFSVNTTSFQTYNDAVVVGANTVLSSTNSGSISFVTTVDGLSAGGQALTVNSAGNEIFMGKVGGTTALASLTTDDPASGISSVPGGDVQFSYASSDVSVTSTDISVTTTGFQKYNDAALLGADTVLKSTGAGDITFGLAVNAATAGAQALTVISAGTTTFLGSVGSTALSNLTTDAAGTTDINGGSVTTTASQLYGDDVILSADTVLTTTGTGLIHFSKTIEGTTSGGQSLTISSVTDTIFGDSITATVGATTPLHDLSVSHAGGLGGTIFINGASINTSGVQTYNYQVVLGNNTTLNSTGAGALGNITFASTVDGTTSGSQSLTANSPGSEIFNGQIGGSVALASVTTDDPASLISGVPGGSTQFNYASTGATDFSVITTGLQTYNDAVILGNNTVLSSTAGGDITFANTVDATTSGAQALTVNTTGNEIFGGKVGATALASLITDDPTSGISGLPDGSVHFNYVSAGPTDFSVTTTGLQTYNDSIVLGANTVLSSTAGGIITLGTLSAGTIVDGGFALTVNTSANEIVNSKIGGTTALASLTTDDPASGVSGLPGGSIHFNYVSTSPTDFSVTTTGLQKYNDSIFLGADTILSSTGGGTITLGTLADGTSVNGAFGLTINSAGDEIFNSQIGNAIALASVTTDDPASGISGVPGGVVHFNYASSDLSLTTTDISVFTTGPQLYHDDAVLGADTVLKTTGDGAAGDIEFFQTLDGTTAGAQGLTVLSTGTGVTTITFNGVVGGGVALRSLTTDAINGHTVFNNAPPTTTISQDFFDDVILMTDTTFTSPAGSAITFHKTINSFDSTARSLTIVSDTDTTFLGAIGNIHPISTLTVIHNPLSALPGTIYLDGGSITTTGAQSYEYRAVLGSATNATVLTSTGVGALGDITFTSTLDTDAAHSFPAQALTVNTAGTLTFMGLVGSISPLSTLTTDAGGSTAINGGGVATTGIQMYHDAVTLGTTPAVLSSTASADSGDIHFYSTVNGPEALTVTTSGITTFDGAVGTGSALGGLTTDGGGSTAINGGGVATVGDQSYQDSLTLATNAALLTGENVHFFSTVDGPKALTVTTFGAITFDGVVGGVSALTSLTTNGGTITALNGGAVTTSTSQTYNDAAELGAHTVLNGSAITFGSSLKFEFPPTGTLVPVTLTINNTSNVAFAGPTGDFTTMGDINVAGSAGTTTITGLMTVNGLVIANNADITGTVTSSEAVSVAGSSTISGTVTSLGSKITLTGASVVHGTLHATDDITMGSTLALTGTVQSGDGDITVGGLLTVSSGSLTAVAGDINLNGGGTVNAALTAGHDVAVIGNLTETGTIHAGNNLTVGGALSETGAIRAGNDITVQGSATITGNALASAGTIAIGGSANLTGTLTAGGNVHAAGAISLGSSLVVTAHGSGGITLGDITGSATSTLKLVTSDTTDAAGPIIRVGSIGGSRAARIGDVEFDSAFVTRLGGDIYANLVTFGGPDGGALASVPTIATISHDAGDLIIDTHGFTMEQNQKLSVFNKAQLPTDHSIQGSLTILSNGGTIQIGDLSASGNIKVDTGSVLDKIVVIARNGGNYLKSDGSTGTDHGLDIVSGAAGTGSLDFTGTLSILVPVGVNASSLVQFAAPTGQQNLKSSPTLRFDNTGSGGVKLLTQDQTITINAATFEGPDFATTGTVLDLAASGVGNPVSSLGTVIAQDLQVLAPEREQAISGALKDALQQLGIFARDLRTDELVDFLIGRALYDDVPYKLNPSPQDNQVSSNRLPYSPVIPTVDAYRALFLKGEVDKDGKPVVDANGKQKMQAQDTLIKNTFGLTWQMYSKDKKEGATPEGYRAYLEAKQGTNPKFAAALGYLNKLRDLLNQIKSLGLTDTEFDVSKKVILAKVRPANIKESDFLAVVMGPSTPRVASR